MKATFVLTLVVLVSTVAAAVIGVLTLIHQIDGVVQVSVAVPRW